MAMDRLLLKVPVAVYAQATEQIQKDVSTGSALTTSMTATGVFPTMVLQMASIGEESGSLDHMLGKAAEFYEDEVDEMVKGLSSLMEPIIIVILGTCDRRHRGVDVPADLQAGCGRLACRTGFAPAAGPAAVPLGPGLLGLVVGSFLNVVVHRLPLMLERQWWGDVAAQLADGPRSAGSSAATRPNAWRWLPAALEKAIAELTPWGWRARVALPVLRPPHPLVREHAGAQLAAAAWPLFGLQDAASRFALPAGGAGHRRCCSGRLPGAGPAAGGAAVVRLVATLLALALIDWDTTVLPDSLTLPLLWAGLVAAAWAGCRACRWNRLLGRGVGICRCGRSTGCSS
jgi:prepilin signal peptidase PulO-like enzyme (type II secretory pathway)